jgi:hypothetical protein
MVTDRILKIIELYCENKSQFYKKTGLSNGFLDKVKDIGVSKLEYILKAYPDINPEWLLTGKGSMLKEESIVSEPPEPYILEVQKKLIGSMEDQLKMKEEQIQELKKELAFYNRVKV